MREPRGYVYLSQEALAPERLAELRLQDLECHLAVVAKVLRQINRGHPARAQLALDRVAYYGGGAHSLYRC